LITTRASYCIDKVRAAPWPPAGPARALSRPRPLGAIRGQL
jgi:hypothetical protein